MENNELQALWKKYDEKLDRIEKLNKQIVYRLISRKTAFKINFLKFQSVYSVLLAPFIFCCVLIPIFRKLSSADTVGITGFTVVTAVMAYMFYTSIRFSRLLLKVHLNTDTMLEAKQKMVTVRMFFVGLVKKGYVMYFVMYAGLLAIIHDKIRPNNPGQMVFLATLLIGVPIYSKFFIRFYLKKIYGRIEQELDELKEYQV